MNEYINKDKKTISKYASKAKQQILINTLLIKEIKIKKEEIKESKVLLKKFTQLNSTDFNIKALKEDLRLFNEGIQNKNIDLIKERQAVRDKRMRLVNTSIDSSDLFNNYRKANEDNFLLINRIFEKEAKINQLNNDTENFSKFVLFKEPRREIYNTDFFIVDEEYFCELACFQELLLSRCKNYNRLMQRKAKLLEKKSILQGQNTNKKSSVSVIEKTQSTNNFSKKEDESDIEIDNPEKIENELTDELGSDSENEIQFEDQVAPINKLKGIQKLNEIIPKIDLKQIEFNKRKVKPDEDTELPLSRRNDDSSIERRVITLRDKIKESKIKIRKKMKKIQIIQQKISRLNNKLTEYEGSSSFTDDKIKLSGNYSATYRMKLSPIQEEL